jgi:hypothetical protein
MPSSPGSGNKNPGRAALDELVSFDGRHDLAVNRLAEALDPAPCAW